MLSIIHDRWLYAKRIIENNSPSSSKHNEATEAEGVCLLRPIESLENDSCLIKALWGCMQSAWRVRDAIVYCGVFSTRGEGGRRAFFPIGICLEDYHDNLRRTGIDDQEWGRPLLQQFWKVWLCPEKAVNLRPAYKRSSGPHVWYHPRIEHSVVRLYMLGFHGNVKGGRCLLLLMKQ